MKICMFTNTYKPHVGGVANSVYAFTEDLRAKGHSVLVVAPTFNDQKEDESEYLLRVPAVQNFNGSDFSVPLPLPFYLDRRLREFDPDIIHSHHPFLLGDSALRAARNLDKPLIFTHHTRYEEYTHYIVSQDSDKMKAFVTNISKEYGNLCDTVIAPSESIKTMLMEQDVHSPIEVIPTGTDISFFKNADSEAVRNKYDIDSNVKIIGHVGRLAHEKNLEFIAKAVSNVLKECSDCVFLVTGDGDAKEMIEEICKNEKVEEKLIMTGQLEGRELAEVYASMDLFVFSSLSETQGMVLVEAMAAETPVIALDAPGAREVIKSGENGELLHNDSGCDQFAQSVLEYISNSDKLNEAKMKALENAKDFSRESSAIRLIETYKQVITSCKTNETNTIKSLESWENLLTNIKTEWELISQKTKAAGQTFFRKINT